MQTFLPYADFKKTSKCLDYKRLGKQRVEAMQIINLLEQHDNGEDISKLPWGNHPAVRMWIGHTEALKLYYNIIVQEWINRGYKNNMKCYDVKLGNNERFTPEWFGRKDFHDAHKSKLLQKDYKYYSKFKWNVPLDLEYKWE